MEQFEEGKEEWAYKYNENIRQDRESNPGPLQLYQELYHWAIMLISMINLAKTTTNFYNFI